MIVKNIRVEPSLDNVLIRLGYKRTETGRIDKEPLLKELKKAGAFTDAVYVYRDVPVKISGSEIGLGKTALESKSLARLLKDCTYATVFFATIGPGLEKRSSKLMEKKAEPEALLLDAIGSEWAEALAEFIQERTRMRAEKKGFKIKHRFSPGYGDLGLSEQRRLYTLCDAGKIGIELTADNFMVPLKSVSAVIGWYR